MIKFKNEFPFFAACPSILWQVIFLLIPLSVLFFISIYDPAVGHGFSAFTFKFYRELLVYPYLKSIANSCVLASITVVLCIVLSFPTAYQIAFRIKRYKTLAIVLLLLPSWTNFIVRIYSWFFLLEKDGFLSTTLHALGFLRQPHLLGNFFAVIIGMVYCYFPFMVIPVYSSLIGIDRNLVEASADLGASRIRTFTSVIFPLAIPGIYAGSVLVFLSGIGEFAVQEILGGAKYAYWGNVVGNLFLDLYNFRAGAAFTFIGLICALAIGIGTYFVFKSFSLFIILRRRVDLARQTRKARM
ncbi:ABC transporter permease [Candidatus Babeliales bacterium]|nr:ABC transporter permease [Candidatus Babeliales bacterium]